MIARAAKRISSSWRNSPRIAWAFLALAILSLITLAGLTAGDGAKAQGGHAQTIVELRSGQVDAWHLILDGGGEVTLGEHWEIPVYDQDNEVAAAALTPCEAPCRLFSIEGQVKVLEWEIAYDGELVQETILHGPECTKYRRWRFWWWWFSIPTGTGVEVDGKCK